MMKYIQVFDIVRFIATEHALFYQIIILSLKLEGIYNHMQILKFMSRLLDYV